MMQYNYGVNNIVAPHEEAMETEQEDDLFDSRAEPFDQFNFKGHQYNEAITIDPITGCHFEYYDLCQRLQKLKLQRDLLDKRLGTEKEEIDIKTMKLIETEESEETVSRNNINFSR